MALSNAEKQRRYRQRALKDPDGLLLTRLQVFLSSSADATLTRVCERTGKTKREIVEAAIMAFDSSTVTEQSSVSPPATVDAGPAGVANELRLYEADSGISAWVLSHQATHAIRQISKNDPNARKALEAICAVLKAQEKQIKGLERNRD